MNIPFVKMHSNGNDFVIVDNVELDDRFTPSKIRKIANRNTGIGFDQFILLEESENSDSFMRIFNSDGNQVEMCGNAARCVASLLFTKIKKNSLFIDTISNRIKATLEKNGEITISMKLPKQDFKYFYLSKNINVNNINFSNINKIFKEGMLVNMGNPHIVFIVSNLKSVDLKKYGEKIEKNPLFKKRINVEIVEIKDRNNIEVHFWERGAGLTKSCGSGIMAAFYACLQKKACSTSVQVMLPIGKVFAKLDKDEISVKGQAMVSFLGQFYNE